jgi:hypothetical protein
VVEAWIAQHKASMARGNVSFDGPAFKSYSKVIAMRYSHFVLMTHYYHSRTTSRHRSEATRQVINAGLRLIPVPYPQVDALNAHLYNHNHLLDQVKHAEQLVARFGEANYGENFQQAKANLDEYELRFGYGQAKAA